jgi:multidrug efflux system membrane fusion protein
MPPPPPAAVTVAETVSRDVPVYLDEIGKCAAREVVAILPQVSGKITKIHFSDGADVAKDQLLFAIDPRPFQAQLDQATATLAQNRAQLALARVDLDRSRRLFQTDAMAPQDYDVKKSAFDVADSQVRISQAAVATAKLNLEYCSIRAPVSGRAGQRLIDVGNVVMANTGPPLLMIHRLDPIYVDFTVTEADLPSVRHNLARGQLHVEARFPDDPKKARQGKLLFFDNAVQDGTGTVKLRAEMHNSDRLFWPGQFVRVRLMLSTLKNAVLVPTRALQLSQQGPFVYVVGKDRKDATKLIAVMRSVQPGQRQGDLTVVHSGLKAAEKVVISGQLALFPDAPVQVKGEAKP